MCWDGKCFSFEHYKGKKVLVFICGPGYLEYPWAIETIFRLHNSGAKVQVVDMSNVATVYAMRLTYGPIRLPAVSRSIFRSILLIRKNRVEIITKNICKGLNIPYKKHALYFNKTSFKRKTQIKSFKGIRWSNLEAREILLSIFSTYERRAMNDEDIVDFRKVIQIRSAIIRTSRLIKSYEKDRIDAAFVANGRQPVQAAVTLGLRNKKISVITYEAGGGYVFPKILRKRLDYFFTSPANTIELQSKVLCKNLMIPKDSEVDEKLLIELLKNRTSVPYGIDFLENSVGFNSTKKSVGRNFAYFATSGWETSVIEISPDYKNKITSFSDQIDSIKYIVNNLDKNDKLFLRLHPIDPGIESIEEAVWQEFNYFNNVEVINSYSKINSYDLAANMDANFTWISFFGFELALKKIPVAVLGDAGYAPLFHDNWIKTPNELKKWMEKPKLCPDKDLVKYIRYLALGGVEIKSSTTDEFRHVTVDKYQADKPRFLFAKISPKLISAIS